MREGDRADEKDTQANMNNNRNQIDTGSDSISQLTDSAVVRQNGHSRRINDQNSTRRTDETVSESIERSSQLNVLQIASSQMEFYKDQVRILRELGVTCDSLAYPPDPSHTEGDIRRKRIHEGWLRDLYGHNALYYAYRAVDFYPRILKTAMQNDYDVVHLNSGMIAPLGLLQPERPIVLTLWGDDLLGDRLGGYQPAITKFCAKRCDRIIVRSEEMREALPCDAEVIPSGIDMSKFKPVDRTKAQETIGWETDARHILFPYSKKQEKKRYPVAKEIVEHVNKQFESRVTLQVVDDVPHEKMYLYYNAADALILPSLREGSPNTVKEAMACDVPVVSTDVGDVATRLGPVKNSYVCASDEALEDALVSVLETGERSDGRGYVQELSLERMGERLIEIYESVLEERDS